MDISLLLGKRILILPHRDADPDATASAILMHRALCKAGLNPAIYLGDINRHSKSILRALNISVDDSSENLYKEYDIYIVVDASTPDMVPPEFEIWKKLAKVIIIDHHESLGQWNSTMERIILPLPSCVEVVLSLLDELGITVTEEKYLTLAVLGILFDTANLRYANAQTLETITRLLRPLNTTLGNIASQVYNDADEPEKLAILKAAQRLKFEVVGDYVIAWSIVGAFEGRVAKRLLNLGIDIVFVGSERKNNALRISARASERVMANGLDLTTIIPTMKEDFGLEGGGHPGAIGFTGTGDIEAVLSALVENTKCMLHRLINI